MHVFKATAAAVSFAVVAWAGAASAATVACSTASPDVTGKVVANAGCQFNAAIDNDPTGGPGLSDFLGAEFFGYKDWKFDARDNNPGTGVDQGGNTLGFSATGGTLSGTWSFANPISGFDVMLAFKGGEKSDPNGLVAYLVTTQSGTYATPFTELKNNGSREDKAISHISVWYRASDDQPNPIPLPAAGWLLIAGLGALVGLRRRTA